jgi:hypothetical protein
VVPANPLPAAEAPPIVTAAWVGCKKEFFPGNLNSDHFPLITEIHEQRWLASNVQTTSRETRPLPDTIFPPDRWFIQNEAERRSVIAEMALTGHLPKKLEYSAWTDAGEGPACKQKLAVFSATAAHARAAPSTAAIQAAIVALNDFGKAAKAALAPTRDLNGAISCKQKGEPTYGTDFATYIKI